VLLTFVACAEHSQVSAIEPPAVRPDGIVAFIAVAPGALPNEYVVRALTRRGVAVEDPGSFVAAIQLGSRNVRFVADGSEGNALRVIAPSDTVVRVAGAAPDGLASGELFAVKVRAASVRDINALVLEISELNDRSGASLRPALTVLRQVTWTR
jgi:hypothetical protein